MTTLSLSARGRTHVTFAVALIAAAALSVTAAPSSATRTACKGGQPVRVGAILPLSGAFAAIGSPIREGILATTDLINKAGGILGCTLTVDIRDDGSDPVQAVALVRQLQEAGAVALLGEPVVPGPQVPIVNQLQIPTMVAAQTDTTYATPSWVFSTIETTGQTVSVVARFLKAKHLTRVGMLVTTDAYGTDYEARYRAALDKAGITLVDVEHHVSGVTDVTSQLAALRSANPQILISPSFGGDLITIMRGLRTLGWAPVFLGSATTVNNVGGIQAVKDSGLTTVYEAPWAKTLTVASKAAQAHVRLSKPLGAWVAAYQKRVPGVTRLGAALPVSEGLYVLKGAIELAGKTDGASIKKALESGKIIVGVRGTYRYSSTNHIGLSTPVTVVDATAGCVSLAICVDVSTPVLFPKKKK